jgi:hypothetical protein
MSRPLLLILSAAMFSIIGLVAAHLEPSLNAAWGAVAGCSVGIAIAALAIAGEKNRP